jgi:pimeloyl-ACP methyl ester carboxylesterase
MKRTGYRYVSVVLSAVVTLVVAAGCREEAKSPDHAGESHGRSQTYSFEERRVEFDIEADHVRRVGTLTIPIGSGPWPAAIILNPSMPTDRDGTLGPLTFFKDLAEYLSHRGIAVLRMDDRGVGESTGDYFQSTLTDFADDAEEAIEQLSAIDGMDRRKIGLIGLSQGAAVASIVASRRPTVGFLVLLGSPGLPFLESAMQQADDLGRAYGIPDEQVQLSKESHQEIIRVLREEGNEADDFEKIVDILIERGDRPNPLAGFLPDNPREAAELFTTPWYRSQVSLDPNEYLTRVRVPTLALTGDLDIILRPDRHLPAIEKALKRAGNESVVIRTLPAHNHWLQLAKTGRVDEAGELEETFSAEALSTISEWIGSLQ